MTVRLKTPNHFLVDEHGNAEAVVLPLADYRKLLQLVEDLSDTQTLKRAIRTSSGTITHAQLLDRLKRQQLL